MVRKEGIHTVKWGKATGAVPLAGTLDSIVKNAASLPGNCPPSRHRHPASKPSPSPLPSPSLFPSHSQSYWFRQLTFLCSESSGPGQYQLDKDRRVTCTKFGSHAGKTYLDEVRNACSNLPPSLRPFLLSCLPPFNALPSLSKH